jgi:hypothetical protein
MAVPRLVLSITTFLHDAPHLRTFDDKIVQRLSGVQTLTIKQCTNQTECKLLFAFSLAIFTALAVLRSHQTRLIFALGAKRPSPPLPKGDLGGMSIFLYSFSISRSRI